MATRAEERLRAAFQQRERRAVRYHGRHAEFAVITALAPIQARLTEGTLEDLNEDDDLVLGHTVKQYDADYGLEVGDTLVVHLMPGGDYAAIEVLHDNEVTPRVAPAP